MILEESTLIDAPPEDVFEFFEQMDKQYTAWHPNHILFRWVDGAGLSEGNVAYFEEEIDGKVLRKEVRFTRIEANRRIEFRPISRLMRLFLPIIVFSFHPVAGGTRVVQQVKIRTGPIGKWINRREFAAVQQHMQEEGEYLRDILEVSD